MTRNPETTEAAKVESSQRIESLLAKHSIGAFCGTDTACSCDRKWRSNAAWRSHVADAIAAVLAVSPAVTDERPEGPEVAERLAIARLLNPHATEYEVGWRAGWDKGRAAREERSCGECGHADHATDCAEVAGYDHLNGDHECGCPGPASPAVTAAEDETRDPDHCSLIAPHFPHSWGPVDVTNLPNWCIGVPAPVVVAVPAEEEKWGREKPHTLTRYGTTNCPVEGVRANVDDGECSACAAPVVAAVPAEPGPFPGNVPTILGGLVQRGGDPADPNEED